MGKMLAPPSVGEHEMADASLLRWRQPVTRRWCCGGIPVSWKSRDFMELAKRIGDGNFRVRVLPSKCFTNRLYILVLSSIVK